jgi:hypothetical protein
VSGCGRDLTSVALDCGFDPGISETGSGFGGLSAFTAVPNPCHSKVQTYECSEDSLQSLDMLFDLAQTHRYHLSYCRCSGDWTSLSLTKADCQGPGGVVKCMTEEVVANRGFAASL